MGSIIKKSQEEEKRVFDPNKSKQVDEARVSTFGGEGIPLESISDEGDLITPASPINNSVSSNLSQAIAYMQKLLSLANTEATGGVGEVIIDQVAQIVKQSGEYPRLQDQLVDLHGVYRTNPKDAINFINNIIVSLQSLLQSQIQQQGQGLQPKSFSTKDGFKMKKNANLKEVIRQHFNNFAVSDIQVITKLQFLNSMLDKNGSSPEEPREYSRPYVDDDSEHFSILHGNGGIGRKLSVADIKKEIKDMEAILEDRGYTREDIDEVVSIINSQQRTQIDITDTEAEGEKEEPVKNTAVNKTSSAEKSSDVHIGRVVLSQAARGRFIGDYSIEQVDKYIYKVKRDDGGPLNNDDEKRIEGIILGKGYENVFVDLLDKDEEGYYTVHAGYPQSLKSASKGFAEKMKKIAATPGLTVGPTTMGTTWCPKTKEPIEEYLCWNTCIDGIKIGEKVVCGKKIFDAMAADNNEHALRRIAVFPHNSPDAVISGPSFRIPDDKRRQELRPAEVPIERRLHDLHKVNPTKGHHTPTLSDGKTHDWFQKVKLAQSGGDFEKKAQDFYNDYIGSLDVMDEDYKDMITKIIATIPVDIESGTVDGREFLAAIDRIMTVLGNNSTHDESIYSFLLNTLGDVVLRYISQDLGRQLLYVVYREHPELERAGKQLAKVAYLNSRLTKHADSSKKKYQFPQDSDLFYREVTKPRIEQIIKRPEESYIEYADRLMSLIANEGIGDSDLNVGWTSSEAAQSLSAAIPYPTNKQFIPVINKIRQFLSTNFGESANLNLAALWIADYWTPGYTNIAALRHIKNHFPEVIRIAPEFHPDHPENTANLSTEEADMIFDKIYKEFPPVSNPNQYFVV